MSKSGCRIKKQEEWEEKKNKNKKSHKNLFLRLFNVLKEGRRRHRRLWCVFL